MAEWTDIAIPKPKDPYKQNLPFKQIYNEYGFNHNDSMYSLVEENRDFRKHIEDEIRMEEVKTQNILGKHVTDENNRNIQNTDTRTTEIKQLVTQKADYVINTLKPEIQEIKQTVNSNTSTLQSIWNKLQGITHWI